MAYIDASGIWRIFAGTVEVEASFTASRVASPMAEADEAGYRIFGTGEEMILLSVDDDAS